MIITIDGYSSQGKSYIGKALARECGLEFLSTGNIVRYVAVQYNMLYDGTVESASVLRQAVKIMQAADMDKIISCGDLKTDETERTLKIIAQHPFVYDEVIKVIIHYAENRDIILDGRFTFNFLPDAHRNYYFISSNERRVYLAAKARKISHEEAREYLAFRDSFEPQCTVAPYVRVIEPESFESAAALLQYLKDDIYGSW